MQDATIVTKLRNGTVHFTSADVLDKGITPTTFVSKPTTTMMGSSRLSWSRLVERRVRSSGQVFDSFGYPGTPNIQTHVVCKRRPMGTRWKRVTVAPSGDNSKRITNNRALIQAIGSQSIAIFSTSDVEDFNRDASDSERIVEGSFLDMGDSTYYVQDLGVDRLFA